ncbi:MAG: MarR family winged helix-turn-helix transcriptional regulator [Desulfobacterales bacterium]|nr:MarR family winged helix-turn-helix transcriptional regulator [Desulfobacterales bacterium]
MNKAGITDIPPSYGDILYLIYVLESGYIKDIVDKSKKDKSTVSNIINQLVKKGYVEKKTDPEDARKTIVRLSVQSRGHVETMFDISKRLKERLFKDMSEEEKSILFLLLNKVEQNMAL